jgi:hypothetical protein
LLCPEGYASNPYLEVPPAAEMLAAPAYVYANASNDELRALIAARELPFAELSEPVAGVRMPGRLTGPLHGVWVHGTEPAHAADSPFEIIDGRLALALADFCKMLAEAGIVELLHYTILRPVASATAPLMRHSGALAIDLGAVKHRDGQWLRVKRDWSPAIGAQTCGAGARVIESEAGQQLRSWVCQARQRGLFHYALSPHFNVAHADHVHLELKPGVKWFLYN